MYVHGETFAEHVKPESLRNNSPPLTKCFASFLVLETKVYLRTEKSNLLPNYGLVLQTEDDNSVNAWEIIKIATHLDTRLFKEQIEEEKRDLN